jgi:hypothetical protein
MRVGGLMRRGVLRREPLFDNYIKGEGTIPCLREVLVGTNQVAPKPDEVFALHLEAPRQEFQPASLL